MPTGFRWFVDLLEIPLGDQASGTSSAPFSVGGQRVRPLICYEDLFGEDIVGSVVGPAPATMFANVSNLAWFGTAWSRTSTCSSRRCARFRERPVVRATNTGATAVVDHRGRVTAGGCRPPCPARWTRLVEGRTGATPYARWLAAWGLCRWGWRRSSSC